MTSRRALEFMGISRPAIIDAAYEIVASQGAEALTPKAVAKAVGIPPAYLGKYFKSFDELQDELTGRALQALIEAHQGVGLGQSGREALEAFALAERAFGQACPTVYAIALRAPRRQAGALDLLRKAYAEFAVAMVRGYQVAEPLAAEVANCLSAALQGFITAEINGVGLTRPEFDRNYERLLDILDVGARSAAGGG